MAAGYWRNRVESEALAPASQAVRIISSALDNLHNGQMQIVG